MDPSCARLLDVRQRAHRPHRTHLPSKIGRRDPSYRPFCLTSHHITSQRTQRHKGKPTNTHTMSRLVVFPLCLCSSYQYIGHQYVINRSIAHSCRPFVRSFACMAGKKGAVHCPWTARNINSHEGTNQPTSRPTDRPGNQTTNAAGPTDTAGR